MATPAITAAGASWKSVRALERNHHLAHGQIRNWRNKGLIEAHEIRRTDTGRKEVLIDEAAVQRCIGLAYSPRPTSIPTRPVVIHTNHGQEVIASQIVDLSTTATQIADTINPPEGLQTTAAFVNRYLELRALEVQAGNLQPNTLRLDRMYLTRWAAHAPIYPWSPDDLDSWATKYRYMKSPQHSQAVRRLTRWVLERDPKATIPHKVRVMPFKSPRLLVPTDAELDAAMAAIRRGHSNLAIFCEVIRATGCRPFELYRRTWTELTPEGFYSPGGRRKPAGHVFFPPDLHQRILELPEPHEPDSFIFVSLFARGGQSQISNIGHALSRVLTSAGITGITLYTFRHAFALHYKDRMPLHRLAIIMRTSVSMLENVYGIPRDETNRDVFLKAYAALHGEGAGQDNGPA